MSLLQGKTAILLELPVRFSDMRRVLSRKQMGHHEWPHLDMSGLRSDKDDGIEAVSRSRAWSRSLFVVGGLGFLKAVAGS